MSTSDSVDPEHPAAADTAPWIVLMGLRASGKSTIGRRIARRLGRPLVDLDRRVRDRFGGRTVAEIWAREGEPAFRDAEAACLDAVLAERPAGVLALGGGTPMVPAAEARLRSLHRDQGRLVYLRGSVELLAGRLRRRRGDRPVMGGGEAADVEREVRWAHEQRDEPYRRLAEVVIELDQVRASGDESPDAIVSAVLDAIGTRPAG